MVYLFRPNFPKKQVSGSVFSKQEPITQKQQIIFYVIFDNKFIINIYNKNEFKSDYNIMILIQKFIYFLIF